jgi:hypothetical protein
LADRPAFFGAGLAPDGLAPDEVAPDGLEPATFDPPDLAEDRDPDGDPDAVGGRGPEDLPVGAALPGLPGRLPEPLLGTCLLFRWAIRPLPCTCRVPAAAGATPISRSGPPTAIRPRSHYASAPARDRAHRSIESSDAGRTTR